MKLLQAISFCLIATLAIQLSFMPGVWGLTVEEQAGKRKGRDVPIYQDELSRKAPERRDSEPTTQKRDPRLACMLSLIVPGGGHVYLRQDLKAVGFCLLTGAGYSFAAYYLYLGIVQTDSNTERKSRLIISGLLFVVGAIVHVVGVVEAYNDAIEINEKQYYYGKNKSFSPYVATLEYR
ncbi:MAG TPA: hypothetical protein VKQ10_06440 [Spirochaetota bacterium]|nr:hypothetical protein [Spirochaetota bacterium]